MDWLPMFEEKRARYERTLVLQGNAAYAAGLALLMAHDARAAEWLRRAAARWRDSWGSDVPRDVWGRPIGALKASLLAGDDLAVREIACWTLELGTATADSPIGRYAGVLALLSLGRAPEARHVAATLRGDDFPRDVVDALEAIAAGDADSYARAVASVVRSFEIRDAFLEDVRVADTALVLDLLARRAGIERDLPVSDVLPAT